MSRAIYRAELFDEDFARQFTWYVREAGETIAWRFHDDLVSTLRRLAHHPDLGASAVFEIRVCAASSHAPSTNHPERF